MMEGGTHANRRGSKQSHLQSHNQSQLLQQQQPLMRRQRSLEWRRERRYSSSDEEERVNRAGRARGAGLDGHVIAAYMAQNKFPSGVERTYRSDTEEAAGITNGRSSPFPGGRSPISNSRQASPYPLESTNTRRLQHYANAQERLRASNGDSIYSGKKHSASSSTLGRAARSNPAGAVVSSAANGVASVANVANTKRHHRGGGGGGMTSSSSTSSTNGLDRTEQALTDVEQRLHRLSLTNVSRELSPPEPAPPEIPPRGPSLHCATLRRRTEYQTPSSQQIVNSATAGITNADNNNAEVEVENYTSAQEFLITGSPRTAAGYPARSPMSNSATITSQQRLNSQLSGGVQGMPGQNSTLSSSQHCPSLVPVFPLRAAHGGTHGPHYSPYSPSRFHIDKRCRHRCSWKCFSIVLILLSVALSAMLAYFAAVSSMKPSIDPSNCILVQDVKSVTHDQMTQDSASTQIPTEESPPTSTADQHGSASAGGQTTQHSSQQSPLQTQQQQSQQQTLQQSQQQEQWLSSVTELRDFDVPHTATIPPYRFWNSEFRNKQPAFIRLNFTLPWGANFAVYGRRNVAPSVTQYDFAEFIKGGRVDHRIRRKRDAQQSRRINTEILEDIDDAERILADGERHQPFFTTSGREYPFEDDAMTESPMMNPRPAIDLPRDDLHIIYKRSLDSSNMVNVSLLQYLDTGRWFLAVYNDELLAHTVNLVVTEAQGVSTTCPNDCSGRGSCYLGKCDCIDGFQGTDCSKSVCPVLCSSHGQYGGGVCHCEDGWKGAECDIPKQDCEDPTCSGHGRCKQGECSCERGWKGHRCELEDCLDPSCSNHGTCVAGQCYCKAGWQGPDCGSVDEQVYQCLPGCSEHGVYDLESGQCVCDRHWTGADCSQAICSLDCGPHGTCEQGRCKCVQGWAGPLCDLLPCDDRCAEHGQCKNGTCVCSQGWNGRHCTLPGCENACSRHGQCTLNSGEYSCTCIEGWAGKDCSIALEMDCNDNIDNDHDGMTDCSDSECCSHPACAEHIMCLASNDPVDVLLRKQPPSVTASFYQRVKFLIEENSVQSYAHMDEYSESRVSVMRGQVVTPQGLGIVGIRVSVDRDSRFGFTLTRQGGWFDVLVNGGGAVTLQFQRSPFRPLTKTVFVPWNQIVALPTVHMQLNEDTPNGISPTVPSPALSFLSLPHYLPGQGQGSACAAHDHELLRPRIAATWMPHAVGGRPGKSLVFAETQIVQESIPIPGSGLHLTYQSSSAAGYLSAVRMLLTGPRIPSTLTHVHVGVEIEGSLHVKTYEADPDLTHTFAWSKRNVYKQKVYGVAVARISVGYQHSTCAQVIWETQTAMLQGFDVDISDIGGWGLNIHHHYNFHEGILQKGDGSTLHLKQQYPRVVRSAMGTGQQRALACTDRCDGVATEAQLLTPVALTSGPDGSLYVGDFNLVRRITPDGKVHTVLQLSATQVAYQYYLVVSPADGHLYISDPERQQVLRALSLESVREPSINSEPVVGSGERCIPGDEASCGDEGPALQARLSHPKGLAIAADKTMYIADGTNIRAVDPKGIIHTLVGHHGHHNHWTPAPCHGAIPVSQAQLQWPTGLALSPLDGSLHFIDDRLVLKLTADMKVKVVAGRPLHCNTKNQENQVSPDTNHTETDTGENVLGTVLAIAFSPNGELYIAESETRRINTIRVVDTDGRIRHFAGKQHDGVLFNNCDCNATSSTTTQGSVTSNPTQNQQCNCNKEDTTKSPPSATSPTVLSSQAKFQAISALAVSQDGVVHIADQGSLQILSLQHYLPTHDESGEFHIPYPATGEIYVFNRYGQHIATRDLTSAKTRYSFLYSKNTSFGKLSTVTDSSGNKIQFLRDYSNVVSSIENTQDHKFELKISGVGFLTKLSEKGKSEIELDYDSSTGLLNSRSGGGDTYLYQYDWLGRVTRIIVPTGEVLHIESSLEKTPGLFVEVRSNQDPSGTSELLLKGQALRTLSLMDGSESSEASLYSNNSLSVRTARGLTIDSSAWLRHPLLVRDIPVLGEMMPLWSQQQAAADPNSGGHDEDLDLLVNVMTQRYSLSGDERNPHRILSREIWVNNSRVIGVQFDQFTSRETFYDRDRKTLLTTSFDPAGLPQLFQPGDGRAPLNITYDRFNRIEGWHWGPAEERYSYDRRGFLAEVTSPQDGTRSYTYNDWNLVSEITLASQRRFLFSYDSDGGLRHVTLPSGTKHSFSLQPSIGFLRFTYTPPGATRCYTRHYSHSGALLQTVFPGDGARVLYRYHASGRLSELLHGDGRSEFSYSPVNGAPSSVLHRDTELEYRWDYRYAAGLLVEERLDFSAKTGLSNAKFTYEYDSNFRVTSIQGRIGGQTLPPHSLAWDSVTGAASQIGQFRVGRPHPGETNVFDGTGSFVRETDERSLESRVSVTIHRMEVFRMEFSRDSRGRISQTRTYTRNVGVNTYTNMKNYTWDCDGQLIGVEAQEPWGFRYDDNGNMLSLTYRGNTIPMEYNNQDRIMKFGEGQYKYESRGLVAQNAREERFRYNARGLLTRATKRGRFDVRYYYDHIDRLTTRKDNFGNVTQFFYTNQERMYEVSQIYSPRDGKLMTLTYDDRGHLIYAQVYRHRYYVATDQCGTPVMVFNQYGEGVREIMRSPYGHIVYDSNPYLYLPVDFCGGLLDQVTSLVHMPGGGVYDPLIGQWMTPQWERMLQNVASPTHLHLYRYNGNDPINVQHDHSRPDGPWEWLKRLGYDMKSLAPQLNAEPMLKPSRARAELPDISGHAPLSIVSGFLSQLAREYLSNSRQLSGPTESPLKSDGSEPSFGKIGAASEPPFGKGIVVSRSPQGRAIVSSVPAANAIYRDVYTSVFNRSLLLDFSLVVHGGQQDAFFFVKEDTWKSAEDRQQLKRLQGQVNTTFHEIARENGSGADYLDVKIHGPHAVINLRYGTTVERERQRLLHHAKLSAVRKAWHREKEALKAGLSGAVDWAPSEVEDILKSGYANQYDGEYVHNVLQYPELAEDPYNIRFVNNKGGHNTMKRRKRHCGSGTSC